MDERKMNTRKADILRKVENTRWFVRSFLFIYLFTFFIKKNKYFLINVSKTENINLK